MKSTRCRADGNECRYCCQVAEWTIKTISRAVFLFLRAFGWHVVARLHLLTTGLLLRAFFEMANSSRSIEEIHKKEK
ncbi:MAG: hypothetical protein ACXVBZ_08070 [Flavisolibacter sp.]